MTIIYHYHDFPKYFTIDWLYVKFSMIDATLVGQAWTVPSVWREAIVNMVGVSIDHSSVYATVGTVE